MKHLKHIAHWVIAVALLTLTTACRDEVAPGAIAGFVSDANSGQPLRNANVILSPLGLSTVSGSDGRYEFDDIDAGRYTLQASKAGYLSNTKNVVVSSGLTTTADIMLSPSSGEMSLSVTRIDFGTGINVQTFNIVNNGANGSFSWSIDKLSPADWLTVYPTSGSTGAGEQSPVTLTVNRAAVTTSSTVNLIVTNNTSGNSISLPVSVDYNSGTLTVSPTVVDFGTTSASRTITLGNSGSTALNYEISYNCVWLTVSPTTGYLTVGGTAGIALSLDRNAFNGNAETIITVRNTNDGSTVSVRVVANNEDNGTDDIVVSSGLMAYYTFDDGTANDLTDNGAHAQMMDGATTATESGGRKYLKISSTQASYLNIPYNFFSGYSYWTVSFWVKDLTAGCVFAAVNSSNNNGYDRPCLWADQGGQLIVYLRDAYHHSDISYNYVNNSSAWHHYTIVRAGGSTGNNVPVKFYVDGALMDNLSVPSSATNGTKIIFGGDKNGSYGIAPSMKVDNIRFYGRALSNNEIQTIYNNEL
ncbi:MAG: carboxypeptidase regulatory-like domain-containing protein [Bacteroidales bacterium]|nr:carboxypeptidase regulatory-like domain-containing protein [Bacteroidales bacterium]